MAKDEKSEFDNLTEELAHVYAAAHEHPNISCFFTVLPDGKLGMRVVGFGKNWDRWLAMALLEWAKHEILNDGDWKPTN